MSNPFKYFNSSPEIIRLAVLMYVKYPLSLRNVEDLLAERGIDICHETVSLPKTSSAKIRAELWNHGMIAGDDCDRHTSDLGPTRLS